MPDPALLSLGCGAAFAAATALYIDLRERFLGLTGPMVPDAQPVPASPR